MKKKYYNKILAESSGNVYINNYVLASSASTILTILLIIIKLIMMINNILTNTHTDTLTQTNTYIIHSINNEN